MIYLIAAVILIALFLYIEDKCITVTEYTCRNHKVPDSFDGFRILHVSDLQSAYFGKDQKSLIKKSENTKPDIIVFTGDLVDRNRTDLKASMLAIKGLQEIAPVYYINGNHECRIADQLDDFYREMEKNNITILRNEGCKISHGDEYITVSGVWDDVLCSCKLGERRRDTEINPEPLLNVMKELTENLSPYDFNILLSHEPQFFDYYANERTDLVFAGHAHGGQIRLPFTEGLFAPGQGILPKLTSGVHRKDGTEMIISRGLGNSVFPFRIFNRPELVLTVLKTT